MGRSNSGKSVFLNHLIIESLKNNIQVIFLDSSMNS
jgi:type IV secretory pathway VirB4 component